MTSWNLLSESNNSGTLAISRLVSSACCRCYLFDSTSLGAAVTMWEKIWTENVRQVSGDLYRSANPCNRTTVFSLSRRARHMNGLANPRINIGVDRLPSKLLGQMHYISWLIEIVVFSPLFHSFFKLDMHCWRSVFLRGEMRGQQLQQSCLRCDTSAFTCDSLKTRGCNLQ